MDVMIMRFTIIFFIILIGLFVIPVGIAIYWHQKYDNRVKWWMLPIVIIYMYLFFNYGQDLIPERWSLEPVQVYQCEWKTNYIPKYPING